DHDRHALALRRVAHTPRHAQAAGHVREPALELVAVVVDPLEVELHPHEELAALGVGRVLVRLEDVRALLLQEAGYRGHDSGPVGAGEEQSGAGGRARWGPGQSTP